MKSSGSSLRIAFAAFVAALPFVPSALAQSNQTWNNGASTSAWNTTDLNWDSGAAAWTNNNNAIFDSTGVGTVTASGVIVNDLTFNTTGYTLAGTIALGNDLGSSITTATGVTAEISAVIANNTNGASALTKLGTGTLVLSGANTYSGGTSITGGGTVRLGSSSVGTAGSVGSNGSLTSGALGTGSVVISGTAATLDLNGQTFGNRFVNTVTGSLITNTSSSTAYVTGAMDGALNTVTANVISNFDFGGSNGNIVWTGVISRTTNNLGITKTGTNTVTFNNTGNIGVGTLTINGGTVVSAVNSTTGGVLTDSVVINNGGTFKFDPTLGTSTGGNAWRGQINGTVTLSAGGTLDLNGSSGQNSRFQQLVGTGGTITNTSSTAATLEIAARNATTQTFGGVIQDGTGSVAVTFTNSGTTGSGRINLFTGANTYTGATTISYGTLELGNALAVQNSTVVANTGAGLGTNSTYAITTTSPLAFAGSIGTFTLGGLSGAGNIALTDIGRDASGAAVTAASVILRIGNNNASTTYSGVLSNGTVSGGGIVKIGSGTLTLSGANTFTGATTVNAGTLATGATGTFGAGNITVASGAALSLGNNASIADTANLTFASGSSIALNFSGSETIGMLYNSVTASYLAIGTYDAAQLNSLFGGINTFSGTGSLNVTATAIPEPSTFAALAGLAGLGFSAVRRRRKS